MAKAEKRARFIHSKSTPPTGYLYSIDHEGETYSFQAPMRHSMLVQLRRWHVMREVEWPGDEEMNARLEGYICQLCPPGFCVGGSDEPRVPFLSVRMIRDATRLFMTKLIRGEGAMAAPEEAERRAVICANCPRNLHGICTGCVGNEFLDTIAWFIRQGRTTRVDQALDTCSVCGCLLKAKVHVSLDVLAKLEKHEYPENCWLYDTACHVPRKKEKVV